MTIATPASATAQPRPLRRFGRSMRAIHDIRIANGTVNCSSKVEVLAGSMLRPRASRPLCTLPPSAAISIIQRNGVVLRGASGVTARAMIAYTMAMNSSGGNAATNGFIEVNPTPQISWTRTARAMSFAGMKRSRREKLWRQCLARQRCASSARYSRYPQAFGACSRRCRRTRSSPPFRVGADRFFIGGVDLWRMLVALRRTD